MLTKAFWLGTGERALKTLVQSLVAAFVVGGTVSIPAGGWHLPVETAVVAAVASIITSIGSSSFVAGKLSVTATPVPVVHLPEATNVVPPTTTEVQK